MSKKILLYSLIAAVLIISTGTGQQSAGSNLEERIEATVGVHTGLTLRQGLSWYDLGVDLTFRTPGMWNPQLGLNYGEEKSLKLGFKLNSFIPEGSFSLGYKAELTENGIPPKVYFREVVESDRLRGRFYLDFNNKLIVTKIAWGLSLKERSLDFSGFYKRKPGLNRYTHVLAEAGFWQTAATEFYTGAKLSFYGEDDYHSFRIGPLLGIKIRDVVDKDSLNFKWLLVGMKDNYKQQIESHFNLSYYYYF